MSPAQLGGLVDHRLPHIAAVRGATASLVSGLPHAADVAAGVSNWAGHEGFTELVGPRR